MAPPVEAVLFDSGGVLIGPVGGRWNPRFDFEPVIQQRAPHLSAGQIARAITVGDELLRQADATPTRDDYHRAMLAALDVEATSDILAELDRPLEPSTIVETFPEVIDVLDTLRSDGVRMAVVSDNWPGLPELHAGVGLGGYFEAYAISAELGCFKPDPRMYRYASDALGLDPGQCLFVDDDRHLVEAALQLGYQGCAVLRDGGADPRTPSVPDLHGLLDLIA